MNKFAALLDALLFTPARLGKLRLIAEYFATTPDPELSTPLGTEPEPSRDLSPKPNIQGSSCQSPRTQRCWRAADTL